MKSSRTHLLLLVALGTVAGPTVESKAQSSEETPTYEYVVQPGDTCAGIAERLLGDKRRWNLIHENNPGMGPTPHKLRAGRILKLPRLDQRPDAELTDVRRTVQTRPPGRPEWARAQQGEDLYRGWRVNTLQRASADVTFQDGAIVQLRQNTLIIIYGAASGAARRRTTEATLERGTLRSRLGELRLDVKTPTAEAGLENGSSVVSVDEEGTSRLSNHEGGEARFAVTQGEAVRVKPGYGSKAKRGVRKPTPPAPLPPSPAWVGETSASFTGTRSAGATVRGSWLPVAEAASYRIEIAKGRDGREVVVSTSAPASVTSFELHRLPDGDYVARVSAIDSDGFESPPSSGLTLVVRLVEVLSPGAPKTAAKAPDVEPEAEPPAPTRVLPGTVLVSPEGYRCGIVGKPAVETLTLGERGAHEVVCTATSGDSSAAFAVTVIPPTLEVLEPETVAPLVRGAEPTLFRISVESELPLPKSTRIRVSEGIAAQELPSGGDVTRLELGATKESPDEGALELVTGLEGSEVVLSALPLTTTLPDELDFAPNEALALMLSPDLFGLTNDRREGTGTFITLGYVGDLPSQNSYWRGTVGVEVAPIRRVRVGLAVPADFAETGLLPQARGDQDMFVWGGYRIFMRRDFSLYTELGVWFPLRNRAESIRRPRFAPALEASYLVVERLLFRTRQGAILETSSDGPFLWASAYGLDIKIVRLFSFSLELDVALGRALDEAVTRVGGGPGLSVLAGPVSIYLAARFAATDDFERSNGRYNFGGGLRLLF